MLYEALLVEMENKTEIMQVGTYFWKWERNDGKKIF